MPVCYAPGTALCASMNKNKDPGLMDLIFWKVHVVSKMHGVLDSKCYVLLED